MENIIQKLSEIEATARKILEETDRKKQSMTEEFQKRIQEYDRNAEEEASRKIAEIRKSLEKEKESQLGVLDAQTKNTMSSLEQYYEKNHSRLARELFEKIITEGE